MAEYISREVLVEDLRWSYEELRKIYNGLHYDEERRICSAELNSFMECILRVKGAPAADVVEVVRCKDCLYYGGITYGNVCRRFSALNVKNCTKPTDFCSYGVKMDGKGEGE